MIVLPLRVNEDGRTVSSIVRMRPVSCPPPSTAGQVYDASRALLSEAYAASHGVATREGTARHQGAVQLEHARLLHHLERNEWAQTLHGWEITELGRFEYETRLKEERSHVGQVAEGEGSAPDDAPDIAID